MKNMKWIVMAMLTAFAVMAQTTNNTGPASCDSAGDYAFIGFGAEAQCSVPIVGGPLDGHTFTFDYFNGMANVQVPRLIPTDPAFALFICPLIYTSPADVAACIAAFSAPSIEVDVGTAGPATLTLTAGDPTACVPTTQYRLDFGPMAVYDSTGNPQGTVAGTQFLALLLVQRIGNFTPPRFVCIFTDAGGSFTTTTP
jgi:hypothetical protein